MLKEFDCGTWQAPSKSNYQFQLSVVDKNASSTGYNLSLDYIKFTPVTFSTGRPRLTGTAQDKMVVLSWPMNAVGFLLEYVTNLAATSWVPALPDPTPVEGWNVVTNTTEDNRRFYRLRNP